MRCRVQQELRIGVAKPKYLRVLEVTLGLVKPKNNDFTVVMLAASLKQTLTKVIFEQQTAPSSLALQKSLECVSKK